MQEMWVQSLGQEDPLEEEMATHSSILAWEIPCAEEPGGLQSMGSQSQTQLDALAPTPSHRANSSFYRCGCQAGVADSQGPIVADRMC